MGQTHGVSYRPAPPEKAASHPVGKKRRLQKPEASFADHPEAGGCCPRDSPRVPIWDQIVLCPGADLRSAGGLATPLVSTCHRRLPGEKC